jgi:hypothetical protein
MGLAVSGHALDASWRRTNRFGPGAILRREQHPANSPYLRRSPPPAISRDRLLVGASLRRPLSGKCLADIIDYGLSARPISAQPLQLT